MCLTMTQHIIRQNLAEVVVLCAIYIERLIEQALETQNLRIGCTLSCELRGIRLRPTPF